MMRERVVLNNERLSEVGSIVRASKPPDEDESTDLAAPWGGSRDELTNAFLAIVAICHQTSPIGERRLEGNLGGRTRVGWDYLKGKFLEAATADLRWCSPERWAMLSPIELSELYRDNATGLTLNRVNERTYLLNDLGALLGAAGVSTVRECFEQAHSRFAGSDGLLAFLSRAVAYADPVQKKALFFCSIAVRECGWKSEDAASLRSPVDYHEMRGHLRIGTVKVIDAFLRDKIQRALPLTEAEDTELRAAIQNANDAVATSASVTSSVLHYLLWNVFRNCCPRPSDATHCTACGSGCALPAQYKGMSTYEGHCIFAAVCESASRSDKIMEPPYAGHYY